MDRINELLNDDWTTANIVNVLNDLFCAECQDPACLEAKREIFSILIAVRALRREVERFAG